MIHFKTPITCVISVYNLNNFGFSFNQTWYTMYLPKPTNHTDKQKIANANHQLFNKLDKYQTLWRPWLIQEIIDTLLFVCIPLNQISKLSRHNCLPVQVRFKGINSVLLWNGPVHLWSTLPLYICTILYNVLYIIHQNIFAK